MSHGDQRPIETSDIPASGVPVLRYRRRDAPADYRRMNEIANAVPIARHDTFFTTMRSSSGLAKLRTSTDPEEIYS